MTFISDLAHTLDECEIGTVAKSDIVHCRSALEDMRVQLHGDTSLCVLDGDTALTQDVCYFMLIAMCDGMIQTKDTERDEQAPSHVCTAWHFLWRDTPCSQLTPRQLDDSFASLFQHARSIDWEAAGEVPKLIVALHLRASELISDPKLEEYHSRRVLWSCAVARLKVFGLQTMQWRIHQQTMTISSTRPMPRKTTLQHLQRFLRLGVENWNGPRLREGLAKANAKRLLRPDEIGRTAAFRGGNPYCRARGTTDTTENALHGLDLQILLDVPAARCVGSLRQIRELLVLKLVHNALEAINACDFMGRHVRLQNLGDCAQLAQSNINMHLHHVWELAGGWVPVPHNPAYPSDQPSHLEEAICCWYDAHFPGNDPLKLHSK